MQFTTDKQTLDDLNIFARPGAASIFTIFSSTITRGGAAILDEMFTYPMANTDDINMRSGLIRYFSSQQVTFPFSSEHFDATEQYLANTDERTKLIKEDRTLGKKLSGLIAEDADYKLISNGVRAIIGIVNGLHIFINTHVDNAGSPFSKYRGTVVELLSNDAFASLPANYSGKLPYEQLGIIDVNFRFKNRELIKKMLRQVYHMDVYITVGKVAAARGFIFPRALPATEHVLLLEGVYHPHLEHAVPNTLCIQPDSNVVFLTGANMAGKSTFMKSLGVAVYLAHMGFPVAASKMEFPVLDGIFTTINLPDNLGMGTSHFYAEVLRVKKIAKELALSKKLFVIIDELFRGTNVNDAHQATIAITAGFARKRNSMFVISTHIIEAGEVLKEQCGNISFKYLPTMLEGNKPVYTYNLETGITADRHGMVIINNEGILDILKIKPIVS